MATWNNWLPPADIPDPAEIVAKLDHLPRRTLSQLRDLVLLSVLLDSGGRVSEVLTTHWRDWVDVDVLILSTLKRRTKGKAPRRETFLSGRTQSLLRAYKTRLNPTSDKSYIFPSARNGGHLTRRAVFNTVKRLLGIHPHMLRHIRINALAHKDLAAAQRIAGHAGLSSTGVYLHPSLKQMRKVFRESNE